MTRGDHIWVRHGAYTHHGIDVGDGTVIHFAGKPGFRMKSAQIVQTPFSEFCKGRTIHIKRYSPFIDRETVVRRAESRLGEAGYGLLRNNCEHFATWCVTGEARSDQVRDDSLSVGALALATAVVVVRRTHLAAR